jgi:hypothetical protein
MKQHRILLLTLRAVLAIGATAFVLLHARDYLATHGPFSIPPGIYALAAYSLLLLVLWISARTLIRQLAADAESNRWERMLKQPKVHDRKLETTHRYPLTLTLLIALLALVATALPYLTHNSGTAIALPTYVACFGSACSLLLLAIHLATYRVAVKPDSICVHTAFHTRHVALTEIREIKVVTTRTAPQIVVLLKDNETVRFGGMLTGFGALLQALVAKSAIGGFIVPDGSTL